MTQLEKKREENNLSDSESVEMMSNDSNSSSSILIISREVCDPEAPKFSENGFNTYAQEIKKHS